jgi:hypothetical protein
MLIIWICGNCGDRLARAELRDDDPHVAALTAEVGEGIIDMDREGNLVVHILCEDCLEAVDTEDDSEIGFMRGPELH